MLTVHHLNISRSHRIIWLLEELNVKYEIKYYERDKKTMLAPAELLAINPLGKAPAITDGDVKLAESGAIIEYILYKYGNEQLKPTTGTPEWIQYLYWLHFAEGSLMPVMLLALSYQIMHQRSPFFIKPITRSIKNKVINSFCAPVLARELDMVEDTLQKHTWLTGNDFTAADIQTGCSFIIGDLDKLQDKPRPKFVEYVQRLKQRPAYQRTIELAGPIGREAFWAYQK